MVLCRLLFILCVLYGGRIRAEDQDLLSVLSSTPSLATFTSLLSTHPSLVHTTEAGSVTILAPANEAFESFFALQTTETNYTSWYQIEALLSYHILHGVHTRGFVTKTPKFLHSCLNDPLFANVSDGQVVEAVLENGIPVYKGAVNSEARHVDGESDLLLLTGVVHIIDTVLTPPLSVVGTITAAPLPHFIDLMSMAVLNSAFTPYIEQAQTRLDTTHFFIDSPNLPAGLTATPEEIIKDIQYNHIPGMVLYSPDLRNGSSFTTAAGLDVTITLGLDGSIWVNDANITRTDLLVSNGIAHVIDRSLTARNPDARPSWEDLRGVVPSPIATGLTIVAKIGIIVGVSIAVIAGALTGTILYHRRRKQHAARRESSENLIPLPVVQPRRQTVDSWVLERPWSAMFEMMGRSPPPEHVLHEIRSPTPFVEAPSGRRSQASW